MKTVWTLAFLFFCTGSVCFAAILESPDGRLSLTFDVKTVAGREKCPVYSVSFKGRPLVGESRMGFDLMDGSVMADNYDIQSITSASQDSTWKPVYGERSTIRDEYNQMTVVLSRQQPPLPTLTLVFRCYDSGVALRYEIPENTARNSIEIAKENTEFRFLADHTAWCVTSAQGKYRRRAISQMGSRVERPLTLKVDDSTYVAIAEAGLVDYARTKLALSNERPFCVVTELSSEVSSSLPLTTPWRVVMVAESPGRLLENNDIILNLNAPSEITDTSWIKPGKVIREVTLTTQGGKACVDFAVKRNLQYIEFDAGWYGHEYSDASDARTVTVDPKRSPGPLDLQGVIRYADERDIGIILYVNRRALEPQIDDLLPLYRQWGIKGLKYGFVRVGSQQWTSWLHEAVRKAAEYQLMIDVHDEYRPTGYSRTYPNFMTQEGIGGDETRPSNQQTLTLLFTRMLAGAADNTICYYDSRVDRNASHAYQLAKAVCLYSPWQFLYWYDRPSASRPDSAGAGGQRGTIGDEPELEFFDHVPTVWDDTKVIHGSIGEYAVIARRSQENWFIGAMNSGEPRKLIVPLDFLQANKPYVAHVYFDDPTVETRTHVGIRRFRVNVNTVLRVSMTAQGGQAIRIVPATTEDHYPLYRDPLRR